MTIPTLLTALIVQVSLVTAEPLTQDELATARESLYAEELATNSSGPGFNAAMELPAGVEVAYKKNPAETLAMLLKVAEGGNPSDSVKAICYALDLREGPGAGVPLSMIFKPKTWDRFDKDWKATPRDHWAAQLKPSATK